MAFDLSSTYSIIFGTIVENQSNVSKKFLDDIVMVEVLARELLSDLHEVHRVRDYIIIIRNQLKDKTTVTKMQICHIRIDTAVYH